MMHPMAPQGAPDQAPNEGAAQGGGASQLIQDIHSGMQKFGSLLEKSGAVGPDKLKAVAALIGQFEDLIESLDGGGDQATRPEAPGAVSSPEAGGNPNARPM